MHSSSKLSFPSQFSNQINNTQKKIHTENTQSWAKLCFHPSKRQTKTTTKPWTFSYFLSSSHQTKTEHNSRVSNPKKKKKTNQTCKRNPPHLQRNPPPMPRRNHYWSHRSPHAKPSDSIVVKTHGVLGLKRAESRWEREKEEREKKRNNERGEKNSRVKKGRESIQKLIFFNPI